MIRIFRKMDIILVLSLILLAAALYPWISSQRESGRDVIINRGGEQYKTLSLSEDTELDLYHAGGMRGNTVTIKNNEATMTYADCPDGLCLRHKPISLTGEIIVCLPNRVIVEVFGGAAALDAVVQ